MNGTIAVYLKVPFMSLRPNLLAPCMRLSMHDFLH